MWHPALAVVLVLAGCAGAAPEGEAVAAEARSTLAAMAAEFQGGQAEEFFARFDRTDFPNYVAFRERTRDFLLRNRQVNVDIIVDAVLAERGEVSVSARWNRSFIDEQGSHKLEDGRCEFVFRRRPSGGLALLALHGDPPF